MPLQRGRTAYTEQPEITKARVLTRADLTHLTVKREAKSISEMRDSHHQLARAIASGITLTECAAICGCSISHVSVMKTNAAFMDLVAHYRAIKTADWIKAHDPVTEYLRNNAMKAQKQIADKLEAAEADGEFLPTRDLVSIAELGLDRTGYGKVNKNVNVNVGLGDKIDNLSTARAKAEAKRLADATINEASGSIARRFA